MIRPVGFYEKIESEDVRPAVGLNPRKLWQEKVRNDRLKDILNAMERYAVAYQVCPMEWIEEIEDHLGMLANTHEYGALISDWKASTYQSTACTLASVQIMRQALFSRR